jgi:hypothetical protein
MSTTSSLDDLPFEEIWAHDFEFIALPGERPDVVCLSAVELRSGRTINLWRDELGELPPYRTDDAVAFVSFSAQAEMACHLALGWPIPRNIIDLSPIFRCLTNGKAVPEGKGLIGMLRYYGFDTISSKHKDAMRDIVLRGWPYASEERERIMRYCAGDVLPLGQLLARVLPDIDLGVALYWGEFAAVSAIMQHNGVPIDMVNYPSLADKNVWRLIRDEMVPVVDAEYGVYVRNAAGDWVFSMERWSAYLKREGIYDLWPRTDKGNLDMRRKTFENMSNLTSYFDLQNLEISSSVPGSCAPNSLAGKPSTARPLSPYFSCSDSSCLYCGVSPHWLATLTIMTTLPL